MSEVVRSEADIEDLKKNQIVGDLQMQGSVVSFSGEGNVLYCASSRDVAVDGPKLRTRLHNAQIRFLGDNSLIMLAPSRWDYHFDVRIFTQCTFCCGDNYFNPAGPAMYFNIAEHCNVIMGSGGRVAGSVKLLTSDQHPLYDMSTRERINPSRSILIGDDTWLGTNASIRKATQVGTGSTVAADAVLAGKRVPSYTVWGGSPARQLRANVFSSGMYVDNFTPAETEAKATFGWSRSFCEYDEAETLDFDAIDAEIRGLPAVRARLERLLPLLDPNVKHRWFVGAQ